MTRIPLKLIFCALCAGLLFGCGNKGDLYLPEDTGVEYNLDSNHQGVSR